MLRQYFDMKSRVPDAILFYRMGDFYEMFFDDAREAAPLLGITLTRRHRDSDIEAPMCGVPWQSADQHIARLVAAGRKVAICDQVEDPRAAKGLVRRDITRIVTPGTVLDPNALLPDAPCWLAALAPGASDTVEWGLAFLDLSTGRFHAGRVSPARLPEVFALFRPREALVLEGCELPFATDLPITRRDADWLARTRTQVRFETLSAEDGSALDAATAARAYALEMRPRGLPHVLEPRPLKFDERMRLDASAVATLELFQSSDSDPRRSLSALLDRTRTPMGARALKEAISRPSLDPIEIEDRWDAVEELVGSPDSRESLRRGLEEIGDLERQFGRIALGTAGPRDVLGWAAGLRRLPAIRAAGDGLVSARLRQLIEGIPDVADLAEQVERTLASDAPALASAGGVIRPGADAELDSLKDLRRSAQSAVLAVEAEERQRSGIPTLRVRFNRVFGYSLEVGAAHRDRVPPEWIRRQSLANAERFVTPALKDLEAKILGAEERIGEIETRMYAELLSSLARAADRLSRAAASVAGIDLHSSLADVAHSGRWVRPKLSPTPRIAITDGRHPLVEHHRREEPFVPNDCDLSPERRILVLTGPNMGGKSTYLRQVGTIVLLAQAGSFVPAAKAELSVVDRIFTRVGAADHLSRGESTFMVEMLEAAAIVRDATPSSLILLDEVGRGTSTFDGLSIAWALVEHLHDAPGKSGLVLFATHYHELTEIALVKPAVANATMAVKEVGGRVVFLKKVVPGAADRSYGIQVAELAGLPAEVTARAREVLANLEKQELDVRGAPVIARRGGESAGEAQLLLFTGAEELVLEKLREADADRMTPIAALSFLASLQERLKE
jgi:DNA mismatch repair protein MutS